MTFFCGGSRNVSKIIDLFDGVFILEVDLETLLHRLERRPEDEFGGKQSERDFVTQLYGTSDSIPSAGIMINTGRPVEQVVDEIIKYAAMFGPW
nr:hypothetical protein [Microlunatus endophyticus]